MQAPGNGEHCEDESTHTSGTNVEPEHENTDNEDREVCDTNASLQEGPEPANAESYTDRMDVGTGANRGRKSAHGGQTAEPPQRPRAGGPRARRSRDTK